MTTTLPTVLDPTQLERIQGTHRGFLFQHVYAAACLLKAPQTGVSQLRVERDEDVELVLRDTTVYAQVKTRAETLTPSDLAEVWSRFQEIREAHLVGKRPGRARFAIVANVEPSPKLRATELASDVLIVTPSSDVASLVGTGLVIPGSTVDDLLGIASTLAEGYRLSALRPDSLVAKLVGLIMHAAAGGGSPTQFLASELSRFCELVAAQIRPLPAVANYRPLLNEPPTKERTQPLILVGHAGDGKSAWAAQLATHTPETAVYIPCSAGAGQLLAPAFVDAAVATLVARGTVKAHELLLPGRTGLDALAVLNEELIRRSIEVMAIIDDCHHLATEVIVSAIRAAPAVRWVLLGRPSQSLNEVAALNSTTPTMLGGWNDDTIAALLAESKCSASPSHVADLRRATGGAPLFVLQAVRAIAGSGGNTKEYSKALLGGATADRSSQEVLLEGTVSALQPDVGRLASALASADLALTQGEWVAHVTTALNLSESSVRRALRALVGQGIASTTEDSLVSLFDVFRPLVLDRFISADQTRTLRGVIADGIKKDLLHERAREKVLAYTRILASLGRLSELADLANAISEWIRETGTISEIREHLEAVARRHDLSDDDRFWSLDSLCFFDIEEGRPREAEQHLREMEQLAPKLDRSAGDAVLHKRLIVAIGRRDIIRARSIASQCAPDHPYSLIVRYQLFAAEAEFGDLEAGVMGLFGVAEDYLRILGLTQFDLLGRNPPELMDLMGADVERSDVHHLADCYDAVYKAASRPEARPEGRRGATTLAIWAAKLYAIAGATRSALVAGQEVADVILRDLGDPEGAREFLEKTLVPASKESPVPDLMIAVRAQHAVVCAHWYPERGARS